MPSARALSTMARACVVTSPVAACPRKVPPQLRVHLKRAAVEHGVGGKRAGTDSVMVRDCQRLLLYTVSG